MPGPDVAPAVKLRDVNAQFLAWTSVGQEMLALDAEGFAVRDLSGAKRVEKACPGRKPGTTVTDAAASTDRATQAVLLDDGHVCVWAGGLPPLPLGRKDWTEIELLDATTLAVGREDGTVEVRELPTGKVRWRRNVGVGAINGLRHSANGTQIYASGARRGGAVFYAATGRLIHTVGKEPSFAIVADPTTNSILLGRGDGRVERWDMRTWRRTAAFDLGDGVVSDLDLSDDGTMVLGALISDTGRAFRAWSLDSEGVIFDQPAAGSGRLAFRFVPGSSAAIANGGNKVSSIWRRPRAPAVPYPGHNVEPPRLREPVVGGGGADLRPYPGDATGLADAVLNPDGSRVVGRDARGVWSLGGVGQPAVALEGAEGLTLPVWWAPNGTCFAAWVTSGELRVWRADGRLDKRYRVDRPGDVAVDGTRVLVAGADGLVRVSGDRGLRLVKGMSNVTAVAFDPARADRFGFGTGTGEVRVTRLSGADDSRTTAVFATPVAAIAFSPRGRKLAASAARVGQAGASVVVLDEQSGLAAVAADAGGASSRRVSMRLEEVPRRLAFLSESRLLVEEPRTVRVIDVDAGAELLVNPGDIGSAGVSGLGVVVADRQGRIRRLLIQDVPLAGIPYGEPMARSADGRYAAVADGDTVSLWNAVTSFRRIELPPADGPVIAGVFDRTNTHFGALTADGGVEVYDLGVGELVGHTPGPQGGSWFRFSPEGNWVWAVADGDLVAWATADGSEQVRVDLPNGAAVDALRSQGRFLTVRLPDGQRSWVDSAEDARRRAFPEAAGERPLAVGVGGKILAVATAEGVERHDLLTGLKVGRTLNWDDSGVGEAAGFTPDGNFLAVVDTANVIRVLDVVTGKLLRSLGADAPPVARTEVNPVVGMAFADNGSTLATFDSGGLHRSWQWGNGHDRGYDLATPGDVHAVGQAMGFLSSPTGGVLYVGFDDGTVRGWDTRTAELSTLLRAHVAPVRSMVLSEDGTSLATGGADGVVRVYSIPEGEERAAFTTLGDPVRAVRLDGATVWAVTDGGILRRWDLTNGKRIGRWSGATPPPAAQAFDPGLDVSLFGGVIGGTRLLGRVYTAHADDRIRLWDPTTGTLVAVLLPLSDGSFVLDRADGRRVASPSLRDGTTPPLFGSMWEGVAP